MFDLYDASSGASLGEITEEDLDFLLDHLEEEDSEDQDYYINAATIDLLESQGGRAELVALLRRALGNEEGLDIGWEEIE